MRTAFGISLNIIEFIRAERDAQVSKGMKPMAYATQIPRTRIFSLTDSSGLRLQPKCPAE